MLLHRILKLGVFHKSIQATTKIAMPHRTRQCRFYSNTQNSKKTILMKSLFLPALLLVSNTSERDIKYVQAHLKPFISRKINLSHIIVSSSKVPKIVSRKVYYRWASCSVCIHIYVDRRLCCSGFNPQPSYKSCRYSSKVTS